MGQSDQYTDQEEVAYLADLPGADPDNNWLMVRVEEGDLNITDDATRQLGVISVDGTVPLEDANGDKINPATQETLSKIASALSSDGSDSLLVDSDSPLDVSASTVTVTQDGTVTTVSENLDAALASNDTDHIIIQEDSPLDVSGSVVTVEQNGDVSVIADNLEAALSSNDGDKLLVEHPNVLDISSRDGRNLGDVDVTALPTEDSSELDGSQITADGTLEMALQADGATSVQGAVKSTGQYNVEVVSKTTTGTEIYREEIANNATAGEATVIDTKAYSYDITVVVTDTSSAQQTVTAASHLG